MSPGDTLGFVASSSHTMKKTARSSRIHGKSHVSSLPCSPNTRGQTWRMCWAKVWRASLSCWKRCRRHWTLRQPCQSASTCQSVKGHLTRHTDRALMMQFEEIVEKALPGQATKGKWRISTVFDQHFSIYVDAQDR